MLAKSPGYHKAARPRQNWLGRLRLRAGRRSDVIGEARKPCPCERAIALRQGGECKIEVCADSEQWGDAAKLDHHAAYGERREKLSSLQRLGVVRQCRDPAVHAALPVLQPPQGVAREPSKLPPGEGK